MRKLIVGLVTASLLLGVGVSPSFAAKKSKGTKGPDAVFKKMDTNGDGKVSFAEFKAFHEKGKKGKGKGKKGKTKNLEKAFAKLDKNKDGLLSLDEFKAAHHKKKKK